MRIVYHPKTKELAAACLQIGIKFGFPQRMDHLGRGRTWDESALSSGVLISNYCPILGAGTFTNPNKDIAYTLCATLDEVVAALTAKPEKQVKHLGYQTFRTYHTETRLEVTSHEVTLLVDGAVRVGCQQVPKDTMEHIIKEYEAYHKEVKGE